MEANKLQAMTFYEKVKVEFDKNNEHYLCHGSETFVKAWKVKWKRLTIKRIGEKFLKVVDKMEAMKMLSN